MLRRCGRGKLLDSTRPSRTGTSTGRRSKNHTLVVRVVANGSAMTSVCLRSCSAIILERRHSIGYGIVIVLYFETVATWPPIILVFVFLSFYSFSIFLFFPTLTFSFVFYYPFLSCIPFPGLPSFGFFYFDRKYWYRKYWYRTRNQSTIPSKALRSLVPSITRQVRRR